MVTTAFAPVPLTVTGVPEVGMVKTVKSSRYVVVAFPVKAVTLLAVLPVTLVGASAPASTKVRAVPVVPVPVRVNVPLRLALPPAFVTPLIVTDWPARKLPEVEVLTVTTLVVVFTVIDEMLTEVANETVPLVPATGVTLPAAVKLKEFWLSKVTA
jgi:hypothetical protein